MATPQAPIQLVTLGDLVADLVAPIPTLPIVAGQHQRLDWLQLEAGGTGNTLVMAARLGLQTVAIGALGDDHAGHEVAAILHRENVDLEGVVYAEDQKTTIAIVFVDHNGDHVFVGASDEPSPLPFQANWPALLTRAQAVFTTGYAMHPRTLFGPDSNLQCMRTARTRGCRIFMDLGPDAFIVEPDRVAEALTLAHVVLATDQELCHWTGQTAAGAAARQLLATGPETVVMKTGAAGCVIVRAQQEITCPAFNITLRDSAGAGDAFAAGYIAARLADMDEFTAGMIANAVGAATAARVGTGSLLPSRAEVAALLKTRALPMTPWA